MKASISLLFCLLLSQNIIFSNCNNLLSDNYGSFIPNSSNTPCIIKNENYNTYQIWDLTSDLSLSTDIMTIRIDSINGLPDGINYRLDQTNKVYQVEFDDVCINFYGASNSNPGKYNLYYYGNFFWSSGGTVYQDTMVELLSFFSENKPRPYLVVVENEADCTHKLTTGISNPIQGINLKVFPNPASGKLFFKSDQRLKVVISNIKGQAVVKPERIFLDQIQVDVSNFSKGIYFYKTESENGETTHGKIIVE